MNATPVVHNQPDVDSKFVWLYDLSGLFLKVRFVAELKCPPVGYVSALTEDFFTSYLELVQGFQHVVLIQASL